ncbi:MAG: fimbrillin family protein [Mediterranea sp.]|jgi:hypothetical protein|nr:fimbrillin family protein [Mediterranea sp.]
MVKKHFLYLSVWALTAVACTNDAIINLVENSGQEIGFSTVQTRSAVFDKTKLQGTGYGFSVAAYTQGEVTSWSTFMTNPGLPATPDFMNNTQVSWSTDKWTYSPIKYWPGKIDGTNYGHVTFFALGGRELTDLTIAYNSTSKVPEYTYTTPATATDQEDLVADVLFDESWSGGKKVKFNFNHILSKIGFTAKLDKDYADTELKITKLQVEYTANKVANSGTYTFETNGTTSDAVQGDWATGTTYLSGNSGELQKTSPAPAALTTSEVQQNDDTKFLMLIPQGPTTAGDLTVKLTYTIKTGTGTGETVTYPVTYQLPVATYEKGKQYIYRFTLTLNPVEFDTDLTVAAWDNPTTTDLGI